jgi:hypothetical protein
MHNITRAHTLSPSRQVKRRQACGVVKRFAAACVSHIYADYATPWQHRMMKYAKALHGSTTQLDSGAQSHNMMQSTP